MFRDTFEAKFPVLVDKIDNTLMKAYAALPDRLYVVIDGTVVIAGKKGPAQYDLAGLEAWIIKFLKSDAQ